MLVALYNRSFEEADIPILTNIFRQLEENEIRMTFFKEFYDRIDGRISFAQAPGLFTSKADLPSHTDMLFSLGGDGTLLDTVSYVGHSNIPIIGVNLGRLGFLAAIPEGEIRE